MIKLAKIPNCRGKKADPVSFSDTGGISGICAGLFPGKLRRSRTRWQASRSLEQFITRTGVRIVAPMVTDEADWLAYGRLQR